MSTSLIVTIAVAIFLFLFMAVGFKRGFLRFILTTLSLVVTILLVNALIDPTADFVGNKTVVGHRLESSIESYVNSRLEGLTGTAATIQTNFIESLPITKDMKTELKANNNMGSYVDQGVSNFAQYIGANLTTLIIRVLCYILLFLVIYLILKLIVRCSNVINHIPILGAINRLAGAVLGLAEGVLFLWIICLGIMVLSGTEFGAACQNVIAGSKELSYIYEINPLITFVNSIVGGVLA